MKLRIFADFIPPRGALDLLKEGTAGHELVFPRKPSASVLAKAEHDPQFATVEVAFGQPDIDAIRDAPRLKWIHVSTSSVARYDHAEFRALLARRGIAFSNSASVYSEACALHALSFLLAQSRSLPAALASYAVGGTPEWHALRSSCVPLRGQTLVILGYGAIGRRLVELLKPFDMKVIAHRRRERGDEGVPVIDDGRLPEKLGEADHVMNILPDSAATRRFFDAPRFAAMKPGAVFYNLGRGSTVDQDALLDALRSKRIKAAWLDVTEPEPLPADHPLRAVPNCFVTPHIAGGHLDEAKTMVRHFLANLRRFERGEPLLDQPFAS